MIHCKHCGKTLKDCKRSRKGLYCDKKPRHKLNLMADVINKQVMSPMSV